MENLAVPSQPLLHRHLGLLCHRVEQAAGSSIRDSNLSTADSRVEFDKYYLRFLSLQTHSSQKLGSQAPKGSRLQCPRSQAPHLDSSHWLGTLELAATSFLIHSSLSGMQSSLALKEQ